MGKKQREREIDLVKTFGIRGLLAYLTGVIQGYMKGFWGDHRSVRWTGRILAGASVFAVAAAAVYRTVLIFPQLQKKAEMDAAIAQAAEEKPDAEDAGEKTEELIQTLLETMPKAMLESAEDAVVREPLDDSIMEPSDIYVEKGSTAVFRTYHPEALNYQWEIYDAVTESWEKATQETVSEHEDELQRRISSLELAADQEQQVRCRISLEGNATVTYAAGMHVLSGQISSISADEYSTDAGTYASAADIPVEITYQDGSRESVIGLSGLYFLEQSESSENSTTESGNMKETITTVRTAHEYDYIDPGSKEGMLLYRKRNGDSVDIPINITGVDQTAPRITELTISEFDVSNVERTIPVTVTIKAEDDVTPLRRLTYAFLPEGEEPEEEDWVDQSFFQAKITGNGIWTAYCRDEAGNIATKEQEIIAADTQAPTVTLSLEKEAWCQENRIFVSAEDILSVEYRYLCEKSGEDSGWISEAARSICKNGEWKIQVRDAAGNVTEQTIIVDNIDTQAPVIRSITEKSEGETISNEK